MKLLLHSLISSLSKRRVGIICFTMTNTCIPISNPQAFFSQALHLELKNLDPPLIPKLEVYNYLKNPLTFSSPFKSWGASFSNYHTSQGANTFISSSPKPRNNPLPHLGGNQLSKHLSFTPKLRCSILPSTPWKHTTKHKTLSSWAKLHKINNIFAKIF